MADDMEHFSPREMKINDCLSAIELQKESIDEAKSETLILVQAKERGEQLKHQKIKLNQVMGLYSDLKRKVISKREMVAVLESLANGEPPDGISAEPELMKQSIQQVRDAKESLSDNISRLTEKLEMAEELYTMFETRRKEVTLELENAMAKKAEVEEYLESSENVEDADQGKKILEKVLSSIQGTVLELSHSEVELVKLKTSIGALTFSLNKSKSRRAQLESEVAKDKEMGQNLTIWFQEQIACLKNLSGIDSCNIVDDTIHLILRGAAECPDQSEPHEKLHLAVKFQYTTSGPILKSAEVDECTLDIEDIVKTAQERNDFSYLLGQVKRRWMYHMPLQTEVHRLRERFAVDWIHSEGKLRVLCGENAHIICTLKIGDKYPARDSILLICLEGLKDGTSPGEIKPPVDHPSLTQWVEYLQHCFEGDKVA